MKDIPVCIGRDGPELIIQMMTKDEFAEYQRGR